MQDALNQDKKEENFLSGTLISCPVAWSQTKFLCWLSNVFRRSWPRNGFKSQTTEQRAGVRPGWFGRIAVSSRSSFDAQLPFVLNTKSLIQTAKYTIQARQQINKVKSIGYSVRFCPYPSQGSHTEATYWLKKACFLILQMGVRGGVPWWQGGSERGREVKESFSVHRSNYCDSSSLPHLLQGPGKILWGALDTLLQIHRDLSFLFNLSVFCHSMRMHKWIIQDSSLRPEVL